jgi:hypothetical protein
MLANCRFDNWEQTRTVKAGKGGEHHETDCRSDPWVGFGHSAHCSSKPASPPYGVAVDPMRQRLFISEPTVNQVEVFNLKTLVRETVLK